MSANNPVQIDSTHCRAICDEIGQRLRFMLDRDMSALPPRLQVLMLRLAAQDLAGSPAIAPAIDEMARAIEGMTGPNLAA